MRQTPEQLDQVILDAAAGIFATHGFAHTSVQQVADAVGYSKAGLLHRYGTKDGLYRAVVTNGTATVSEILASVEALGTGPDRLRDVLALLTEKALERPGMVRLMLRAFDPVADEPYAEDIQSLGYRLVDLIDVGHDDPAERLRVVLALQLLVNAAQTQQSDVDLDLHLDHDDLVPLVVQLAAQVLGR